MDYIENVTVERMKKVIEGEQGGISKKLIGKVEVHLSIVNF